MSNGFSSPINRGTTGAMSSPIIRDPQPSSQRCPSQRGGAAGQRGPLGTSVVCNDILPVDPKWAKVLRKWNVSQAEALAKKKEVERNRLANTWGGIAVKAGGHLVFGGKSSYGGRLWNLADNDRWCNFSCSVRTFGFSLGGGTEVGMVFFLNTKSLYRIEGMEFGNGSQFCTDVPGKQLKLLVTALESIETLVDAVTLMSDIQELASNLQKFVQGKDPMVVYKKLGGASAEIGWKHGIQGKIDIHGVQGKHGYLDEL